MGPDADEEEGVGAETVVIKLLDANRTRVDQCNGFRFDSVSNSTKFGDLLGRRRLEALRNDNVAQIFRTSDIPNGEPSDGGDATIVRHSNGYVAIRIALQPVRSPVLAWHNETLVAGPDRGAGPKEGVLREAIVEEVLDEKGELVDGVDIAVHLVRVGVQLAHVGALVVAGPDLPSGQQHEQRDL